MTCPFDLKEYALGECPREESRRVEAHVAECDACRRRTGPAAIDPGDACSLCATKRSPAASRSSPTKSSSPAGTSASGTRRRSSASWPHRHARLRDPCSRVRGSRSNTRRPQLAAFTANAIDRARSTRSLGPPRRRRSRRQSPKPWPQSKSASSARPRTAPGRRPALRTRPPRHPRSRPPNRPRILQKQVNNMYVVAKNMRTGE